MFDSVEAIAVYRGWHALEERLGDNGVEIIDFDLVPNISDSITFSNRQQVRDRIQKLRDSVLVADEITEFIRAKLNASCYFLRILQEGSVPEFYQHVRTMLGKTPELVSAGQISMQQDQVWRLLSEFGVPFEDGRPAAAELQQFDDSIRIDESGAEGEAIRLTEQLLPVVLDILGIRHLQVPYRIKTTQEDKYWYAWSSGSRDDLLLRLNFHPTRRWRKGDMEYLVLHEVCGHFVHATCLARQIENGRLDPFIGVTTVHDPHGFMGEGIADALTYFFPDEIPLSEHAILAREQRTWRDYLNNNAHILVNTGGLYDDLLSYILQNPFVARDDAQRNLTNWQTHPLWRSYQYSYGIAMKYHRAFAAVMSREQRIEYLRYAITRYVTPERLIAHVDAIAER